jgi:hypothetical protein
MKAFLLLIAVVSCLPAPVLGDLTYTFTPLNPDLSDLPHGSYFIWGIKWALPTDQTIVSAKLTYKNIYDTESDPNSRLYTHLLDNVANAGTWTSGTTNGTSFQQIVIQGTDVDGGGDKFAGQPYGLIGAADPWQGTTPTNLVYNVDPNYLSWLSQDFGFAVDPDCHFVNTGIEFQITTRGGTNNQVPAPASIVLVPLGLGLLGMLKRKFA